MRITRYITIVLAIAASFPASLSAAPGDEISDYDQVKNLGRLTEIVQKAPGDGRPRKRVLVYLPPGYDTSAIRYPVLYLLHGARGNETSWIRKGRILDVIDSLTMTGKMSETITVFPNMNQYDDEADYGDARAKGAWESFFEMDGSAESVFREDVVGLVDSLFRTIPDKGHRAIAGLSLGGMQTIHISASCPDMFGYVGAFSPIVKSVVRHSRYSRFYKGLKQKFRVQFADPPRAYRIMIGRNDFLLPHIESFHNYLNEKDYPHDIYISPGGHQWKNWRQYCIIFMEGLWK